MKLSLLYFVFSKTKIIVSLNQWTAFAVDLLISYIFQKQSPGVIQKLQVLHHEDINDQMYKVRQMQL
jgi:hypothetical protein